MCVEISRNVLETLKVRTAWKSISSSSTATTWYPIRHIGEFKRGKWVKAKHYYYGFNCYSTKKGADSRSTWSNKTVKVRVRRIHGYGKDGNDKVIFAREIFVPKGRKRKWLPFSPQNVL
jgi:hypothetical protein